MRLKTQRIGLVRPGKTGRRLPAKIRVLDFYQEHGWLLILGRPGSGQTTTLQRYNAAQFDKPIGRRSRVGSEQAVSVFAFGWGLRLVLFGPPHPNRTTIIVIGGSLAEPTRNLR